MKRWWWRPGPRMIPHVHFPGFVTIQLDCGHWTHVHEMLLTEEGWENRPWWCIDCPGTDKRSAFVLEIIRPGESGTA